ncbi:MAG: glycosyltransferase family 39 protein [Eubacteriales bacterium]
MNRKVLLLGILTRTVVFAVIYLTFYSYYPGRPPAPLGYETSQGPLNWHVLNPLLLYDGSQYIKIAQFGYTKELAVWFPLYPLLIKTLGTLINNLELAAVVVANIAFLTALVLIYSLARLDFGDRASFAAAVSLMLIPAGVYFNVAYTESLFLALVMGAFYAARKKHWWLAGVLGGLAALTRNLGIFVFPALIIESHYQQIMLPSPTPGGAGGSEFFGRQCKNVLGLLLIPLIFSFYPGYLLAKFGDPLAFIHGQAGHFRAFRFPGWGLWADIIQMLRNPVDPFNFIILLNLLAFLLGAVSLFYIERPSYRFFGLTYLLVISAMPLVQ